jgi:hypothetical protein
MKMLNLPHDAMTMRPKQSPNKNACALFWGE